MIISGFHTSLTLFVLSSSTRDEMSCFFSNLIRFLYINSITEHKVISDRLYRRYLRKDEIYEAYSLINSIEKEFLEFIKTKQELYNKYNIIL